MRTFTRRLLVLAVLFAATAAHADDFDSGLQEWTFFQNATGTSTYNLTWSATEGNPAGGACVQGDFTGSAAFGLEKTFTGLRYISVRFDWRARSDTDISTVTNLTFDVVRVSDGEILYVQSLLAGTLQDSGWQVYPTTDLTPILGTAG